MKLTGAAPPRPSLARIANLTRQVLASGEYEGAIWTQGSPQVEETAYWFNLLVDTPKPICGNAAQRLSLSGQRRVGRVGRDQRLAQRVRRGGSGGQSRGEGSDCKLTKHGASSRQKVKARGRWKPGSRGMKASAIE